MTIRRASVIFHEIDRFGPNLLQWFRERDRLIEASQRLGLILRPPSGGEDGISPETSRAEWGSGELLSPVLTWTLSDGLGRDLCRSASGFITFSDADWNVRWLQSRSAELEFYVLARRDEIGWFAIHEDRACLVGPRWYSTGSEAMNAASLVRDSFAAAART